MEVPMGAPFAHTALSKILSVQARALHVLRTQTLPRAALQFLLAYVTMGSHEMAMSARCAMLVNITIPVLDCVTPVEAVSQDNTFQTAQGIKEALAVLALPQLFRRRQT